MDWDTTDKISNIFDLKKKKSHIWILSYTYIKVKLKALRCERPYTVREGVEMLFCPILLTQWNASSNGFGETLHKKQCSETRLANNAELCTDKVPRFVFWQSFAFDLSLFFSKNVFKN